MTKKNEAGCDVCGGSVFDIHPARREVVRRMRPGQAHVTRPVLLPV